MMIHALLLTFFFADTSVAPDASQHYDYSGEILNMVLTLGSIIAAVIFVSWALKRLLHKRMHLGNSDNKIKIIERRALSPKASLYLVEVLGKTLVIGESPSGLTRLSEITDEEKPIAIEQVQMASPSFASILKNKFKKPYFAKEKN
ncbi:MAG: flagellar biosynthetic protein FliO [Chlamydiales bacterium]|nr:flagellar biosynthetic protein FliO [Chlamydiales bacterium]